MPASPRVFTQRPHIHLVEKCTRDCGERGGGKYAIFDCMWTVVFGTFTGQNVTVFAKLLHRRQFQLLPVRKKSEAVAIRVKFTDKVIQNDALLLRSLVIQHAAPPLIQRTVQSIVTKRCFIL